MAKKKFSRARAIGARAITGGRATAIGVAAGAGAYYGLQALVERVAFVRDNWVVGPALLVVGGHFLKQRKNSSVVAIGQSAIGAGSYAGAMAFNVNRQAAKATETQGMQFPSDTRGLQTPGDPYALSDNYLTGASPETSAFWSQDEAVDPEPSGVETALNL